MQKKFELENFIGPYQNPPAKGFGSANHFSSFESVFKKQPFKNRKIAGHSRV